MGENIEGNNQYDFLVSFAEDAKEWVYGVLVPKLGRTGKRFALEGREITGKRWLTDLQDNIESSHTILLILSPQYLTSGRQELIQQLALLKVVEKRQWRVIPIMLKSIERELVMRLIDGLDLTKGYESEERLDALLEVTSVPSYEALELTISPYPGMVAFAENDAKYFFGREDEIDQYTNILRDQGILALIGASGCGKSSLAKAGIIPKLEKEHGFLAKSFRLTNNQLDEWLSNIHHLVKNDLEAAKLALFETKPKANNFLLFIDQFEELFTFYGNAQSASGLSEKAKLLLNRILFVKNNLSNFYLLITIRAEFYPQLALCQSYINFDKYLQRVNPLRQQELKAAITKPALKKGVYVAELLVERLVNDAGEEAGILPFVQETMRELWSKRYESYISLDKYENLGGKGVSGLKASIARKADAAYNALPSKEHENIAKRIFIRLIQFGEGKPDTRRQQTIAALRSEQDSLGIFEATLQILSSEKFRLLIINREVNESDSKVDIAHEALIQAWPKLQGWLFSLKDIEYSYRYLSYLSEKWEEQARSTFGLLNKKQLQLIKPKWIEIGRYGASKNVENYWKASVKYNNLLAYREISKSFLIIIFFSVLLYAFWLGYGLYAKRKLLNSLPQVKVDSGVLPLVLEVDTGVGYYKKKLKKLILILSLSINMKFLIKHYASV